MKAIQYDLSKFNPVFRDEVKLTIDILNAKCPPFGRGITRIEVDEKYNYSPDDEHPKYKSLHDKGYGLTNHNSLTGNNTITFTCELFGVNGDLEKYKKYKDSDNKARFHGEMSTVGSDIAHEYGHAFEGMLRQVFIDEKIDKDNIVTNVYHALMKKATELVNASGTGTLMRLFGINPYGPERPYDGKLVSGYAEQNPNEFFAETFAAVFCDKSKSDNPTVVLMNDLIRVTYEQIKAVGEDVVDRAAPIDVRLNDARAIVKKASDGKHNISDDDKQKLLDLFIEVLERADQDSKEKDGDR